ncbi:MAG: hypothetical protein MK207_11435 [Saprospiraceae bacterium]|nr:hypothetical protein [Saprospiraceae bacterium]
MKNKLHLIPLYLFSFGFIILMSSYSVDYSRIDSRDDGTKISQKDQRRNLRMEQRKSRLENRLNKSKKQVQRQRIQKKIRMIKEKQKNQNENPVFGIVGIVLSIVAVCLSILLIIAFFQQFLLAAIILGAILALPGLIFSIVGLNLSKNKPERFGGKGLSIAGLIISSILLLSLILFLIIYAPMMF